MGFKDLPGGQNDKGKQSRADLAKEISPPTNSPQKNK